MSIVYTNENAPNLAVAAVYITQGFFAENESLTDESDTYGGHIGAVSLCVEAAQMLEELVHLAVGGNTEQDFPGVFEYEVTEECGTELRDAGAVNAEWVHKCAELIVDFFSQSYPDDSPEQDEFCRALRQRMAAITDTFPVEAPLAPAPTTIPDPTAAWPLPGPAAPAKVLFGSLGMGQCFISPEGSRCQKVGTDRATMLSADDNCYSQYARVPFQPGDLVEPEPQPNRWPVTQKAPRAGMYGLRSTVRNGWMQCPGLPDPRSWYTAELARDFVTRENAGSEWEVLCVAPTYSTPQIPPAENVLSDTARATLHASLKKRPKLDWTQLAAYHAANRVCVKAFGCDIHELGWQDKLEPVVLAGNPVDDVIAECYRLGEKYELDRIDTPEGA